MPAAAPGHTGNQHTTTPTARTTAAVGAQTPQSAASDRTALQALYDNTNGPNWTNKTCWKNTSNYCKDLDNWYGVTTDTNGHVTSISLTNNRLSESIPTQIGNLTHLTP